MWSEGKASRNWVAVCLGRWPVLLSIPTHALAPAGLEALGQFPRSEEPPGEFGEAASSTLKGSPGEAATRLPRGLSKPAGPRLPQTPVAFWENPRLGSS